MTMSSAGQCLGGLALFIHPSRIARRPSKEFRKSVALVLWVQIVVITRLDRFFVERYIIVRRRPGAT